MHLIEEYLKILKFMSEMTGRVDLIEFAKNVGLTSNQILQDLQELTKEGFLKKGGGGFTISEKGKAALKTTINLSSDKEFSFYLAVGQPTNFAAKSIKEFYDSILKVDVVSLEFHLGRGDFENWFKTTIIDVAFAEEFAKMKNSSLKGEELRQAIAKATKLRYSL